MLIQTLHEQELEAIANLPTRKIHGNLQRLLLYGGKLTSEVFCQEKARQRRRLQISSTELIQKDDLLIL